MSSVVIQQMADRYRDKEEMEFTVMDATNLDFFPNECFDLIIDKGEATARCALCVCVCVVCVGTGLQHRKSCAWCGKASCAVVWQTCSQVSLRLVSTSKRVSYIS